jgi:lysophospholipase L1-like esterase
MKPFRTFIFFAAVLLLISLVALVVPEQGIGIGGDLRLSFLSFSDLSRHDSLSQGEKVERLLSGSSITDDPESDQGTDLFLMAGGEEAATDPQVIPVNADSLKQQIYRISFPEGGARLLHSYFNHLDGIASGRTRLTRILHFGDSQIENNRMTALIRYRLQKHFGGSGTGLVQAIPLYSRSLSYDQEQSGDWLRYTYFGKRDSTITHKSYGIMGAFASVPVPLEDEWPSLHYRFNTARRSGQASRIRIFMHSYVDSASVALQINESYSDTLRYLSDGFSVADHRHHEKINEVKISFMLPEGGRIYGISFESGGGLQVDNIAMRGGSGLIFTGMDRSTQVAMLDQLSPGLILLQYGGNVVPYINASYYQRAFKRQLQFFKHVCPGIPIIVIGPSDMSVKEDGVFVTYPGLEKIRDALKSAALESGFAFWDLYEAMGGYNSMASFVHADPPLASTDYVHFTGTGINLVAEMFYNALMLEYNEFHTQKRTK